TPVEETVFMAIEEDDEIDNEQEEEDNQSSHYAFMFHLGPPTKIAEMRYFPSLLITSSSEWLDVIASSLIASSSDWYRIALTASFAAESSSAPGSSSVKIVFVNILGSGWKSS
ncbi:hypothetical protein Tco_0590992, partial [Tanacetum coccineum]